MDTSVKLHPEQFRSALEKLSEDKVADLVDGFVASGLNLSKEEKQAVEFVFWLSARIESFLGRAIQEVLGTDARVGKYVASHLREVRQEVLKQTTDDLYLGGKVQLMSRIISAIKGKKFKLAEEFLGTINRLRNDISHNRFKYLEYKGQLVTELATKKRIIGDFKDIFQDIGKKE